MNRNTFVVLALATLLLAAGLRFYRISERSLWLDEAVVANYARQSFVDNITKTGLGSSSPIAFPVILQAVQRTHDSVFSIRATAALFSLLAIATTLLLPGIGFDRNAALVAAAVLAVSPSQVRYAQEVREYSLGVFLASLIVVALVGAIHEWKPARAVTVATAFLAPLVQYGLVFLVASLLVTMLLEARARGTVRDVVRTVAWAGAAFVTGAVITYVLTLRHQIGREMSYLDNAFFHGSVVDVGASTSFLASRLLDLGSYLTFGNGGVVLAILLAGLVLHSRSSAAREDRFVLVFAVVSVVAVAVASLVGLYPFGAIRQNLVLAPPIAIALGVSWTAGVSLVPERARTPVILVSTVLVLACGVFSVVKENPYQEIQDVKSVIRGLEERRPADLVYVHYGSRPAMRYYRVDGPEFRWSGHHRNAPGMYVPEFRDLVGGSAERVWIVFTHASKLEKRQLLDGLVGDWRLAARVRAPGARLYLARRRNRPEIAETAAGESH